MRYLTVFDEKSQKKKKNGSFNTMMLREKESNVRKVNMTVGCT